MTVQPSGAAMRRPPDRDDALDLFPIILSEHRQITRPGRTGIAFPRGAFLRPDCARHGLR
ncbi:hypothetical protein [Paracoccus pacificus]|uniref:Uncharacterized protein n=1 Tax=Paracoccus pacificus TaxID=1463598 RepID=A0ABW4RB04_9RHOB